MIPVNFPTGLPDFGYSMQAAGIASALIQHEDATTFRKQVREWLDRIENPFRPKWEDIDNGQELAEFLTDLVRVGSGLPMEGR
jgi:hypothetical protein